MYEPCSEIDRAVGLAADEFGLDHKRFRLFTRCESHFQDRAESKTKKFVGLHQHDGNWEERVRNFNKANEPDLGSPALRINPFDSSRLTAWMIKMKGYRTGTTWSCKY